MAENARPHRILFIDAFDSFTHNLTSHLATLLNVQVHVVTIDAPFTQAEFLEELRHYSAVVLGPGPGSPDQAADVGLMDLVWQLQGRDVLPVLGVCLGFQSLALSCGAGIRRLRRGMHGMVRPIEHCGLDVFGRVGEYKATLYHSLGVDIGQDEVLDSDWERGAQWQRSPACADLVPLAWTNGDQDTGSERILMAARHRSKPFWGLQYHPESVCTEKESSRVISNWWREALQWNQASGRHTVSGDPKANTAVRESHLAILARNPATLWNESKTRLSDFGKGYTYTSAVVPLPSHIKPPHLVEILKKTGQEQIILDSANAHLESLGDSDYRGRYSILAMDVESNLRLEYCVGDSSVNIRVPKDRKSETVSLQGYENVWQFLSHFQALRRTPSSQFKSASPPFKGGFMGYITYEMGLEGIDVKIKEPRGHKRPDICFVWVTRSMVIDHRLGLLHIQELRKEHYGDAYYWVHHMECLLEDSRVWKRFGNDAAPMGTNGINGTNRTNGCHTTPKSNRTTHTTAAKAPRQPLNIKTPNPSHYQRKVRACQEYISAGHSYELCLTSQTHLPPLLPSSPATQPWPLYTRLRTAQPSPFSSFIRLATATGQTATLISSSPERFLSHTSSGLCSMRPMKGTVRKSAKVATLQQAERLLRVPKEEAENLMIVDLVRHDLHSVCGAGRVNVRSLLAVEEYASVFQMITVVEGHLSQDGGLDGRGAEKSGHGRAEYTGLDVLAASLPPGSMTGAPKKRSCEILQDIEQGQERGLYSGVVGYMDITGNGDWSVTIRSIFRYDDENYRDDENDDDEQRDTSADISKEGVWRIGAGGAVTILSTPEGECDEMMTKLSGPLGVLRDMAGLS